MKANNIGLGFARTCNDRDNRLPKGRGDCFDFGQWYGCQVTCPVFVNGECKTVKECPKDFIDMVIEAYPINSEEWCEIVEMYPELETLKEKPNGD